MPYPVIKNQPLLLERLGNNCSKTAPLFTHVFSKVERL